MSHVVSWASVQASFIWNLTKRFSSLEGSTVRPHTHWSCCTTLGASRVSGSGGSRAHTEDGVSSRPDRVCSLRPGAGPRWSGQDRGARDRASLKKGHVRKPAVCCSEAELEERECRAADLRPLLAAPWLPTLDPLLGLPRVGSRSAMSRECVDPWGRLRPLGEGRGGRDGEGRGASPRGCGRGRAEGGCSGRACHCSPGCAGWVRKQGGREGEKSGDPSRHGQKGEEEVSMRMAAG